MTAFDAAVNAAMQMLARDERTVFVGQSVRWDGAAIYNSLAGVPMEKRIEMPVIEDFQVGFCIGLALTGKIPICMFPRMDFLLLAANQIVNHLDKLPLFGWRPRVILRTTVGKTTPLDAGPQHTQDHTGAFRLMCQSIYISQVHNASQVKIEYDKVLEREGSSVIVENPCQ